LGAVNIFLEFSRIFFRMAGVPKHGLFEPCVLDNSSLDCWIFTKFGTHVL